MDGREVPGGTWEVGEVEVPDGRHLVIYPDEDGAGGTGAFEPEEG